MAVRDREDGMSVRPLTRAGPAAEPFAMGHSVG